MENKFTIGETIKLFPEVENSVGHKTLLFKNGELYAVTYGSTPEEAKTRAELIANAERIKEANQNMIKDAIEIVEEKFLELLGDFDFTDPMNICQIKNETVSKLEALNPTP